MEAQQASGAPDPAPGTGGATARRPPSSWSWGAAAGVALVAGLGAAVLVPVALRGTAPYRSLGVTAPPELVRFGTPVLLAVAGTAGALGLGGLVAACFVLPSGERGRWLGAHAYAAVRRAGAAAGLWSAASCLLVAFLVANGSGAGLDVVSDGSFAGEAAAFQLPVAFAVSAVAAAAAAVIARVTLSWRAATVALALAVLAAAAPPVAGFAASLGADHDVVTDVAVLQAVVLAVWLGAAHATAGHLARGGPHADLVRRRYRRLSGACAATLLVSTAVVDRWMVLDGWLSSSYGRVTLAQAVVLVLAVLLTAGTTSATATAASARRGLLAVASALAAVTALGAVLVTDVPPGLSRPASAQQTLLGFDLPGPPTVLGLLAPGRVDVLFDLAAVLLAVAYALGVRRLHRRGDRWPAGRSVAWVAGCALLAWTTSSGLARYAMGMFSAHMGTHMLLSMPVPVLLALGGPVTLALRALPAAGGGPDGPREWIRALTESPPARALTLPPVALTLFVGSFSALYFSGLFASALPYHWAHQLMSLHFVLVGYLFFWPVIGTDPAPRPLPHVGRLALVLASMPFHAFFGVALLSANTVIGARFLGDLALPWVPDLLADQTVGGGIAWATGELPLLLVVVALMVQWSRHDDREGRRRDRHADRDGDGELRAWNAMLADMAHGRR